MDGRSSLVCVSAFAAVAALAGCGQASGDSPASPPDVPNGPLTTAALANNPRAVVLTGDEPFNPFGMPQIGVFNDLGTVECPGGEPTVDPTDPCSAGSLIHQRGWSYTTRVDSADPRLAGWVTVAGNANLDATGSGREWGTWSEVLDDGVGVIAGNFEDAREVAAADDPRCLGVAPCWIDDVKGVGKGTEGSVSGTHYQLAVTFVSTMKSPLFLHGTLTAVIVPPP